jgi:hypothetical protein
VAGLADKYAPLIEIRRLSGERQPGVLLADGDVFTRLGLLRSDEAAQYLVRPDGYIAFRCAGSDLRAVDLFMSALRDCRPDPVG